MTHSSGKEIEAMIERVRPVFCLCWDWADSERDASWGVGQTWEIGSRKYVSDQWQGVNSCIWILAIDQVKGNGKPERQGKQDRSQLSALQSSRMRRVLQEDTLKEQLEC